MLTSWDKLREIKELLSLRPTLPSMRWDLLPYPMAVELITICHLESNAMEVEAEKSEAFE